MSEKLSEHVFIDEFKLLVTNQKFTQKRADSFENLFDRLRGLDTFEELSSAVLDQLCEVYQFKLIQNREPIVSNKDIQDKICRNLLVQSKIDLLEMAPLSIVGDGNCLFRSISKALYSEEKYHLEIRYRTLVELIMNKDEYIQYLANLIPNGIPNWFHECAPGSQKQDFEETYLEQIMVCSKPNSDSTLIHVFGVSQALKIDIDQVYPSKAGYSKNSMIHFLNQTIICKNRDIQGIVKIVWSNYSSDSLDQKMPFWNANHFVAMLPYNKSYYKERVNVSLPVVGSPTVDQNNNKIKNFEKEKRICSTLDEVYDDKDVKVKSKKLRPKLKLSESTDDIVSDRKMSFVSSSMSSSSDESSDDSSEDTSSNSDVFENVSSSYSCCEHSQCAKKNECCKHPESSVEQEYSDEDEVPLNQLANLTVDSDSPEFNPIHFSVYDAIKYVFNKKPDTILPKCIVTNNIFFVDLNRFTLKDVLADDNGAYKEYGNKTSYYIINNDLNRLNIVPKKMGKVRKSNKDLYELYKCFYRSLSNESLLRKTYRIKNCAEPNTFYKIVICYTNTSDGDKFSLKCHGNSSKVNRPYVRKTGSCLEQIKQMSIQVGSLSLKYGNLVLQAGEDCSLSTIPSSTNQLYKHKSLQLIKKSQMIKSNDEYSDALINRQKSDFVRSFNFERSSIQCVMFTHQQYIDIIRFGCTEGNFSILNIDTTFKLGRFYVTMITYKNLSLYINGTRTHPTFIGPIMIHLNRDFDTYLRFAQEIKSYDYANENELNNIKVFITDDDASLHSAFAKVFSNSEFMLCCNHMRKDVCRKLNQFLMEDFEKEEIIERLFGSERNRDESLIASDDKETFNTRSNDILEMTNRYEHKLENLSLDRWLLKYSIKKMYNSFTKLMWRHKTKVNNYYTTNDIEGVNNRLKHLSERKPMNLSKAFEFFEEISESQKSKAILAIRMSGDYQVSAFFSRYETRHMVWNNLSDKQRSNRVKAFLKKTCHQKIETNNITKKYKPIVSKKKKVVKKKNNIKKVKKNKE